MLDVIDILHHACLLEDFFEIRVIFAEPLEIIKMEQVFRVYGFLIGRKSSFQDVGLLTAHADCRITFKDL